MATAVTARQNKANRWFALLAYCAARGVGTGTVKIAAPAATRGSHRMFDFVRTHSRLMLGLMVLLIFPSFVFFGIQGYSRFTDGSAATVAKVDGTSITRAEWDSAHQRQLERLRRQIPNVDPRVLDTPELRRRSLDALVLERVMLAASGRMHLAPGNDRMQRLFHADPNFAALRNPDGTVNRDAVASQGMSIPMLEQQLRTEYAMQQVLGGIRQSAFGPSVPSALAIDALLQRREIQFERFDPAAFAARVQPSDAEIEAFYKANAAQFAAPEEADIEYVVLDVDALTKDAIVTEAELRKYYDDNAARFTAPEERRVSHILIKADKDKPAAERDKARARAQALLEEARKNPAGFAELARKNSEDTGSATQGGDLDFFPRGAMVKPFEDTAFAMKQGEISNVVETDFGFHILQLNGARGGDKKPFEAVKAEIDAELRKAAAAKAYAQKAEEFSDLAFTQSESLKPLIDKLKLTLRTATVKRNPEPGATGPLASQKLLAAIFSDDVVRNKRNSEAVEVGSKQMAAARIVNHRPARTLPLADVKDRVRQQLVATQSAALARKEGEARLAAVRGDANAALPNTATVSRSQVQGVPRPVIDAVLRADSTKLPQVIGVDVGEQGYVVARVTKVVPRDALPGGDAPMRAQYGVAWANVEADAYFAALKKRYKTDVKEESVAAALKAASAAGP